MGLSPEERRQIYEEEKARLEAQEKARREGPEPRGPSSLDLPPRTAGLLCYVGGWISGLVFLILEQKNSWVRFHAAQSIVVFGILNAAAIFLGWMPVVGAAFAWIVFVIAFVLWLILMLKAYSGARYKLPWVGDVAETMTASSRTGNDYQAPPSPSPPPPPEAAGAAGIAAQTPEATKNAGEGRHEWREESRAWREQRRNGPSGAGRVAASAAAIAWNLALLIFFNFFHQYFAFYNGKTVADTTVWTRYPLFNSDLHLWLPVLTAALVVSIIGHIVLIAIDRRILNEVIHLIMGAFGLAAAATLLAIFPFDFHVLPNATAGDVTTTAVFIVLILICFGIGIGLLVRLIRLILALVKAS
jgi:uncharacterized membrane protein